MTAAPGDSLEFGEGSAAQNGERRFPGVTAAFRTAYAGEPHRAKELGEGVCSYALDSLEAEVYFVREKNKLAILAVRRTGTNMNRRDFSHLTQMAAMFQKRGLR